VNQKNHSDIDWPKLVRLGKSLVGKPYRLGAEVNIQQFLKDPRAENIKEIDCSELVEVLFAVIGITVPDGSYNQIKVCRPIIGEQLCIGDLGFKANPDNGVVHHVGIYIGDNTILEAKGKAWGTVLTPLATYAASSHFYQWGRLKCIAEG
jgi:cell wall-associated NlpC family hydrolase